MKVSWIMPVYRLTWMIPQVIADFKAQTWTGKKELVILNDDTDRTLLCKDPEVRCINWHRRFRSLGGKYGIACSLATGDLLMPTDVDDGYGPNRISDAVDNMVGGFYKCASFYIDTDPVELVRGRIHCNYAFTPQALIGAGCYNLHLLNRQSDMRLLNVIDYQMAEWGLRCRQPTAPSYLYRRLSGSHHTSSGSRAERIVDGTRGNVMLEPAEKTTWDGLKVVDKGRMFHQIRGAGVGRTRDEFWNGIDKENGK